MVAPHDCYGGTYRLFSAWRAAALRVEFVDQTDPDALRAACARKPRLVWIETPSNPLLRIVDIRAAARLAQACGALLVVDNTFLSPGWQRPIALGADLVVHSTTKYLNGHSDVVGGAVMARTAELHEQLAWWANCLGVTGSPFDSYLTLRGLRTLHARLAMHQHNARALVDQLLASPAVARVYYPGLPRTPATASPPPSNRLRRHGQLRAQGRHPCRGGLRDGPALLLAGRIARRRREPGRAPGDHDACGDGR